MRLADVTVETGPGYILVDAGLVDLLLGPSHHGVTPLVSSMQVVKDLSSQSGGYDDAQMAVVLGVHYKVAVAGQVVSLLVKWA